MCDKHCQMCGLILDVIARDTAFMSANEAALAATNASDQEYCKETPLNPCHVQTNGVRQMSLPQLADWLRSNNDAIYPYLPDLSKLELNAIDKHEAANPHSFFANELWGKNYFMFKHQSFQ